MMKKFELIKWKIKNLIYFLILFKFLFLICFLFRWKWIGIGNCLYENKMKEKNDKSYLLNLSWLFLYFTFIIYLYDKQNSNSINYLIDLFLLSLKMIFS